jgi:hypothetical protein
MLDICESNFNTGAKNRRGKKTTPISYREVRKGRDKYLKLLALSCSYQLQYCIGAPSYPAIRRDLGPVRPQM